ncbi:MAG: glycosyltransferase family 2 protein [Candidatus Bathyarchaeia archaeon]
MIDGKKIIVVMPAYNASKTLGSAYADIPKEFVDEILLVDDASTDNTSDLAQSLGIPTVRHDSNKGYGANQKTCYRTALGMGADIVVMLHPDYQYSPRLIPAAVTMLAYGPYDVVLGSRILTGGALRGGMPLYKYVFNRILTAVQNLAWGTKISEFHTGFRAFKSHVLEATNFEANSDDFVFDNQIIAQILWQGYSIGEISCPTSYAPHSSSIGLGRGVKYGFGVLKTTIELVAARKGIYRPSYLQERTNQ